MAVGVRVVGGEEEPSPTWLALLPPFNEMRQWGKGGGVAFTEKFNTKVVNGEDRVQRFSGVLWWLVSVFVGVLRN